MKSQHKWTVLVLDDDETNLEILAKTAQDAGYDIVAFDNGMAALEYMREHPTSFDITLMDKMMPDISGIEILKLMKASPLLKHIPVVIQTGDVGVVQMCEGIDNGAYYYLTKPFHPEVMTAILHSAANECLMRKELLEQMNINQARIMNLLHEGEFLLKTHSEARVLSAALSRISTHAETSAIGLMELMSNAIEHGNLGIGYERKCQCLWSHQWQQELQGRAQQEPYKDRVVCVSVSRTDEGLHVVITDQGDGFDWRAYIKADKSVSSLSVPNGRGLSKAVSVLDGLHYVGSGNEVHCDIAVQYSDYMPLGDEAPASEAYRRV